MTGIKVVRGSRPMTDGKCVYLPRLPDTRLVWDEVVKVIAYLYHECAHILWSDFTVVYSTPLQKAMGGVLEDIRIEHRAIHTFPAARKYLGELVRFLVEADLGNKPGISFGKVSEAMPEGEVLQRYMLYRLRHDVLKQTTISPLLETAVDVAEKKFPAGMLVKLDALMFQVTRCTSEAEVFDLTNEIIKMIAEEKEEEQKKEEQRQPQPQGAGGHGAAEAGGESEGESQDAAAGTSPPQQPHRKSKCKGKGKPQAGSEDDAADGGQNDSAGAAGVSGAGGKPEGLEKVLGMTEQDIIEGIGEMLEQAVEAIAETTASRGTAMPNIHPLPLAESTADLATVRGSINAIRTKTLAWMSSAAESDTRTARTGITIDPTQLYAVPIGGDIFIEESEGIDLNAAMDIVIDRSGSMSGEIKRACTAALASMLAFEVPGIVTQVSVFPVYGSNGVDAYDEGVSVIKRWEESPRALARRIGSMTVAGGTPMAEALLFAGVSILQRQETLRIVMVVTDGDPNDKAETRDVIGKLRNAGVVVVGLGIGVDPSGVFGEAYSTAMHNTDQLAGNIVKLVRGAMLRK